MKCKALRVCLRLALVAGVSGGRFREGTRETVTTYLSSRMNASANRQISGATKGLSESHLAPPTVHFGMFKNFKSIWSDQEFGDSRCPCIGIDNVLGKTVVHVDGDKVDYPADLGAQCNTWDATFHPKCKGKEDAASFCGEAWCYVDPCNCDLSVMPRVSEYLPDGEFQGRPVHYSYLTCGGDGEKWPKDKHAKAVEDIKGLCSKEFATEVWGEKRCRCIGITGQPGEVDVRLGNEVIAYPADLGAMCQAWDEDKNPECLGADAPKWCSEKWCYVDPCDCNLEIPPKENTYLPGALYRDRPIFYSYASCGGVDHFTASLGDKACVNMKGETACDGNTEDSCKWDHHKKTCAPKELQQMCKGGAAGPQGAVAVAHLVLSIAVLISLG